MWSGLVRCLWRLSLPRSWGVKLSMPPGDPLEMSDGFEVSTPWLHGRASHATLLGRWRVIGVNVTCQVSQPGYDLLQQITAIRADHTFFAGDAHLDRIIFPPAQDFDLVLLGKPLTGQHVCRRPE